MNNLLRPIEDNYPTERIVLGGLKIWPILRLKVNEKLRSKNNVRSRSVSNKQLLYLLNPSIFFYGFKNFLRLRKYSFWLFSSSERRKELNGKYVDRIIEPVTVNLPDSVVIENPFPAKKHFPKNHINQINIVSQSVFFLFSFFLSLRYFFLKTIKNEFILESILNEAGINLNYKRELRRFYGQYLFIRFLLKIKKPKCVFFVYSASSMGMIKAFKESGVPVVELQHGIINMDHNAYVVPKDYDTILFPDYLLSFGQKEKNIFSQTNYFIEPEKVFAVGYYYLEEHLKLPKVSSLALNNNFKLVVAYSFQDPFAKIIVEFLINIARICQDVLFIIVPRNNFEFGLPHGIPNLIVENNHNIYDVLKISDLHATINSTCAIEALCFGVPTIFYDYENWASNYYKDIFEVPGLCHYAKDEKQFAQYLGNASFLGENDLKRIGASFFKKRFYSNLLGFLSSEILKV